MTAARAVLEEEMARHIFEEGTPKLEYYCAAPAGAAVLGHHGNGRFVMRKNRIFWTARNGRAVQVVVLKREGDRSLVVELDNDDAYASRYSTDWKADAELFRTEGEVRI